MNKTATVFIGYIIQFIVSVVVAFYGNFGWLIANLINITFFKLLNTAAEMDGLVSKEKDSE